MSGDPVRIELTGGRDGAIPCALVDADDVEIVSQYRWGVRYSGRLRPILYAVSVTKPSVHMHRLITRAPTGMVVDHIDHDGLNNRRSNLRIATNAQNFHWRRPGLDTLSRYKGVFASSARSERWCASIECAGNREYLGSFATEEEAARVYDYRARQLFGEFAWLNFPSEELDTPPQVRRRGPRRRVGESTASYLKRCAEAAELRGEDESISKQRKPRKEPPRPKRCPQGHKFTPANTYVDPTTGRWSCRACSRIRSWRRKKTGEAAA